MYTTKVVILTRQCNRTCVVVVGPYAALASETHPTQQQQPKRKRSWSRAVFSNLQRKGLEKRFEVQKYVTKPDRRQLAAMLGLTDAQVSSLSSVIYLLHKHVMQNVCQQNEAACSWVDNAHRCLTCGRNRNTSPSCDMFDVTRNIAHK